MKRLVGVTSVGVALASGVGCSSSHEPPEVTPRPIPSPPVPTLPPFPTLSTLPGPDAEPPSRQPSGDDSGAGPWTGVLKSGVMAIGGETTGMTLTTADGVYELRASGPLLGALRAADGRRITVQGNRRDVAGVESRRVRQVIDVSAFATP